MGPWVQPTLISSPAGADATRFEPISKSYAYGAELNSTAGVHDFAVKPQRLDFGSRPLGSVTTLKLWLRNKGAAALPLLRVFVRGENRSMVAASHACGAQIAPGTGCAIHVSFTPTLAGPSRAKVVVVAGSGQVRERVVTGLGLQEP